MPETGNLLHPQEAREKSEKSPWARSFTVKKMFGVLIATLALIVPFTAFAGSAQADVGTRWQNWQTGNCLDSNYAGDVYTNPCQVGNEWQTWDMIHRWDTTWAFRNRKTGLCLKTIWPDQDKILVRTRSCSDRDIGQWRVRGSDWQNVQFEGGESYQFCLDAGRESPIADGPPGSGMWYGNCNYGTYQTWRSV
jgi:hypothetical protein